MYCLLFNVIQGEVESCRGFPVARQAVDDSSWSPSDCDDWSYLHLIDVDDSVSFRTRSADDVDSSYMNLAYPLLHTVLQNLMDVLVFLVSVATMWRQLKWLHDCVVPVFAFQATIGSSWSHRRGERSHSSMFAV